MRLLAYWWAILRDSVTEFGRDNALTHAAAISFASVLSLFPALLGLVALFGLVLQQRDVQREILQILGQYLPPVSMRLIEENIKAIFAARGSIGLAAAGALLWTASALGGAVRNALNVVLDAGRPRHWVIRKAIEIGMVLLGGLALLVSVSASAAVRYLKTLSDAQFTTAFWQIAGHGLPVVAVFVAYLLLYAFVPTLRLPRRSLALGAAVGALLFEAAKAGFFWYFRSLARYQLIYGSVAGVVIFLAWVYLSSGILLFGAEIADHHARASGHRAEARPQE